jgi:Xaa-Pro aminopeptidase
MDNSVVFISSARETKRSRDTEYPFRQDSDFYYFTGFNEPDCVLLLSKRGEEQQSLLFNRSKDRQAEIWTGRRLGQKQALAVLGVDQAYPIQNLDEYLLDLLDGIGQVYLAQGSYPERDQQLFTALDTLRRGVRQNRRAPGTLIDWRPMVHEMRLFKSDEEIALMRQAAEISGWGHVRAMRHCRPGLYEYQLQAEIEHEFARHGARHPAYGTIVGGGENACILHYTENDQMLRNGDLVLIDAGAEYKGYAGDITRTFPVNGRFAPGQRRLYELVLRAQTMAIAAMKPGAAIKQINLQVIRILTEGLLRLGIIHGELEDLIKKEAYKEFYMHGLGHWLGLDVHDVGDYHSSERERPLQPGMVLTVEPGLYIPPGADVPSAYCGTGIRIEDNVLITDDGCENLTLAVPKSIEAIEQIMAPAGQ